MKKKISKMSASDLHALLLFLKDYNQKLFNVIERGPVGNGWKGFEGASYNGKTLSQWQDYSNTYREKQVAIECELHQRLEDVDFE